MLLEWLSPALALLRRIPREAWYILVAVIAWWFFSSHYMEKGREEVKAELRAAEAKGLKEAVARRTASDKAGEKRAIEFAEKQGAALDAIEQAEAEGDNPLDEVF